MNRIALKKPAPIQIMLDSGAFSAWKLEKSIDIVAYCNFLNENLDWIDQYVTLNVVVPNDPERAAKESLKNFKFMLKEGLKPIPVLHAREPIEYLDRFLDLGCEYIGLSAAGIGKKKNVDQWYEFAWERLTNNSGDPVVKVHAFGVSNEKSLTQFPWASADVNYQQKDETELNTPAVAESKKHTSAFVRSHAAAKYFVGIERRVNALTPVTFKNKGGLILGNGYSSKQGLKIDDFQIYLITGPNPSTFVRIYSAGGRNILYSYFYMTNRRHKKLRKLKTNPEKLMNDPRLRELLNHAT